MTVLPPEKRAGVIVVGSINVDLVVATERLPRAGETVLGGRFLQAVGGKGANQAVAAARYARTPPVFVATLGDDDFGRLAFSALACEPLDTKHIRAVPAEPTGVALIVVDSRGENQIAVASGANAALSAADIDGLPDSAWSDGRVLLACLESPLAVVGQALRMARKRGLTTILNPAPADRALLDDNTLAFVDVLTPNETEAAALAERGECADEPSCVEAATRLLARGARAVVVTRGAAGSVVVTSAGATSIAAERVQTVDATAAGDTYNGVLAVAMAEGAPLADAARIASRAAALATTRVGALPSIPHRSEIVCGRAPGEEQRRRS